MTIGHRQERDDQRLLDDLLALEAEQQDQSCKQREQRDRLQPAQGLRQRSITAARQQ